MMDNFNNDRISCTMLSELDYTLWNENVLLYEIENKKNNDFIYLYLDLFNREDKDINNILLNLYNMSIV